MKNTKSFFVLLLLTIFFSCREYHVGYILNNNAKITYVEFGQNNFEVVGKVSGISTEEDIVGFAGKSDSWFCW